MLFDGHLIVRKRRECLKDGIEKKFREICGHTAAWQNPNVNKIRRLIRDFHWVAGKSGV